jgi:beta-glucosidase/6-phospho-beta-glucosidase/beta-galactosidase
LGEWREESWRIIKKWRRYYNTTLRSFKERVREWFITICGGLNTSVVLVTMIGLCEMKNDSVSGGY